MIKPTVGRIVWFYPCNVVDNEPRAAIITKIHGDRCVSLAVFGHDAPVAIKESIQLVQDGDTIPPDKAIDYCTWPTIERELT